MRGKPIPEREPISDPFSGLILQLGKEQVLAVEPHTDSEIIAQGDFVIRYGLRYLGRPQLSVVPGLVVLDYGDFLRGEEAWEFLTEGSNLYPRSEVVGYRNDGVDEIVVIKALDIGIPPEVLVYEKADATIPIAKPSAIIAAAEVDLPLRLLEFLPRFTTLTEWQAIL